MVKRMLIDATHEEETRVAVMDGSRLVEFDYESLMRKQLKGNIFLAKVTRVEPSLQAAFVNFGGNRHGFLPFAEIHPDYFRIPIADREALLEAQRQALEAMAAAEEAEDAAEEAAMEGRAPRGHDRHHPAQDESDIPFDERSETRDAETDDNADNMGNLLDQRNDLDEEETVQPDDSEDSEDSESEGDDLDEREPAATEVVEDDDDSAPIEETEEENNNGQRSRRQQRPYRGRGGQGRRPFRRRRGDEIMDEDPNDPQVLWRRMRRQYKIQEVIKRGQIMLVQVSKEERGNKGAAVSTYLSLPGRYSVLMPNSPRGGGVSRKIANYQDRRRLKDILRELNVPSGMSVIVRTAGVSRETDDIKRDLDYLMRLWNKIRELTLQSSAPALVYEEGELVKRAIRDIYTGDIDEIHISGKQAHNTCRDFMGMMMPGHEKKIQSYTDERIPLFHRYQVESQIADIGESVVTLRSGGYLVIHPTEALVSVDVNSGRATRERHIEETALKTNLEAADEVARQLRLRDLGGLVVVDFIDMEDRRNNARVEQRLRQALSRDRARVQMGRISMFGLLELSRQRLNPSLTETQFKKCESCEGMGHIRTDDTTAIMALRALEEEGIRGRASGLALRVPRSVALYILNHKRSMLDSIEKRYEFTVDVVIDDLLAGGKFAVDLREAMVRSVRGSDDGDDAPDGGEDSGFDQDASHEAPPLAPEEGDQGDEPPARPRRERGGHERGGRRRSFRNDRPHPAMDQPFDDSGRMIHENDDHPPEGQHPMDSHEGDVPADRGPGRRDGRPARRPRPDRRDDRRDGRRNNQRDRDGRRSGPAPSAPRHQNDDFNGDAPVIDRGYEESSPSPLRERGPSASSHAVQAAAPKMAEDTKPKVRLFTHRKNTPAGEASSGSGARDSESDMAPANDRSRATLDEKNDADMPDTSSGPRKKSWLSGLLDG